MNAFSFFFWLRLFQAFGAIFRSMDIFLMQMYTTCFPMFLTMKLIGATLSSFSCNLSNHLPNMLLLCLDLFECSFNSVDSLSETWRVRYILINLHSATLSTFKTSVVVTVSTWHIIPSVTMPGAKSVNTVFVFPVVRLLWSPEPKFAYFFVHTKEHSTLRSLSPIQDLSPLWPCWM